MRSPSAHVEPGWATVGEVDVADGVVDRSGAAVGTGAGGAVTRPPLERDEGGEQPERGQRQA